ncbi:MAG: HlyD family type I secretion periplasmic adaptor subunit [Pseudomonadota bacterium]
MTRARPPTTPPGERLENALADLDAAEFIEETSHLDTATHTVWVIAAALMLFLIWAAATPVYEVVSGPGEIKPEGLVTRVEHLDGGIVASVQVTEGSPVAIGDLLVKLDDSELEAERAKVVTRLDALEETRARLVATLADPAGGAPDPAQFRGIDGRIGATLADAAYRRARVSALDARRAVSEAERLAAEAQIRFTEEELAILNARIDQFERFSESGAVARFDLEDARREGKRLESTLARLKGEVAVQQATADELGAQREELIASYRRDAALSLAEIETEIAELSNARDQLERQLERTAIRAPAAGTVNSLAVTNAAQVVRPGALVAEIVPRSASVFAEIEVPADRIGTVAEGDPAQLKILTHDFTRFGDVDAVVASVSPSSFQRDDGSTYFRVRLDLGEEGAASTMLAPGRAMTPGMTVTADIRLGKNSVLTYLLKPLRVLTDEAFSEG